MRSSAHAAAGRRDGRAATRNWPGSPPASDGWSTRRSRRWRTAASGRPARSSPWPRAVPGHERAPRVLDAWWALSRRTGRTRPRGGWAARILPRTSAPGTGARTVRSVGLSRDGRIAAYGTGIGRRVGALAVAPDGRYALSGSDDGTARLWEPDWELAPHEPEERGPR